MEKIRIPSVTSSIDTEVQAVKAALAREIQLNLIHENIGIYVDNQGL